MTAATPTVAYTSAAFRAEREGDWQEFERLVKRLESGSIFRRLSDEDLLALPRLYRATLSGLSIARAISLDAALVQYLEALSMRGYFLLYGVRETRASRLQRFFASGWPDGVRSLWRETLIITALLFLGMAVSWALVASDVTWYDTFMPGEMANGRVPGAPAEMLRSTLFGNQEQSGMDVFAFSLFTHNSQVSILSYALGFAFGLPTMLLETYQGVVLGAMSFVFWDAGLGADWFGWLFIHGTTEIFAAILSGAAGLRIGTAVAFPGRRSRMRAASEAGKQTGAVIIGVILMLLAAGFLEGFGRQMVNVTWQRYTIGAVLLVLWCTYFYAPRAGRVSVKAMRG